MRSAFILAIGFVFASLVISVPVMAQDPLLDWGPSCFGWETDYSGHISNPGSELTIYGRIDTFYDPLGDLDPDLVEYTFVFEGLTSLGTAVIGGMIYETDYTDGTFKIYADVTPDFDFGVFPPNATAPSSFVDGDLVLEGTMANFHVFLIDTGAPPGATGTMTADWECTGGTLSNLLLGCGGPVLGTWTDDPDVVPIPQGYTNHTDGKFDLLYCPPTPAKMSTWGLIKSIY
ncbi:MAG: hypothetical protein KJ970_11755 [Candidatus Eisenbacteria bacterium]|uniref:Uncharacterized protein n=1 Tax=Eiseniibacteriota bacterium TaxID=2212470 RepID=A0A948RV60_UNCEI|nr:hypothetical protein [Candidatus Eisenbacteria bacterium]MBU1950793.1 hypothetical protein [Candidatus Eisenbacteria bacterium]MBU2691593.1 hypothetical protein [Candidatus Eisenbacteria bacterium]